MAMSFSGAFPGRIQFCEPPEKARYLGRVMTRKDQFEWRATSVPDRSPVIPTNAPHAISARIA
jgi:hypothetical protein